VLGNPPFWVPDRKGPVNNRGADRSTHEKIKEANTEEGNVSGYPFEQVQRQKGDLPGGDGDRKRLLSSSLDCQGQQKGHFRNKRSSGNGKGNVKKGVSYKGKRRNKCKDNCAPLGNLAFMSTASKRKRYLQRHKKKDHPHGINRVRNSVGDEKTTREDDEEKRGFAPRTRRGTPPP